MPELEYLQVDKMKLSDIRELHYYNGYQIIELKDGRFFMFQKGMNEIPRVRFDKEKDLLTMYW